MKQIWKGKLKIRVKKECPYYATAGRHLEKVLFNKWGFSVSLWTVHPDSPLGEFSDWAKKRLMQIFPGCQIEENKVYYNDTVYFPGDIKWIFKFRGLTPTDNPQVFLDVKRNKYIGYSHRACAAFGFGDMLFDPEHEKPTYYYRQAKYRRKYLLTLLKYHIKRDAFAFEDICEDEIIGHGIMQIVPFRERGSKRIETGEDARKAASNFAKYVS